MAETKTQPTIKRQSKRDGEQGEGSVAYVLTKPVDLAQLGQEIAEAQGLEEVPGISAEGILTRASVKTPVTLWIFNPADVEVDPAKVRSVVSKHSVEVSELDKLMVKAQAGEDLDDKELQAAVRSLLLRVR